MLRSLGFVSRLGSPGGSRRLGSSLLRLSLAETLARTYPRMTTSIVAAFPPCRNYVINAALKQDISGHSNVDLMLNDIDRIIKTYGYIKKKDVENVMHAVMEKGSLSSTQGLLLIRCCGEFLSNESLKIRRSLVNQVWETIKDLNVPVDVSHYNALLLINLENETDFSPLDILLEMKKQKIEPNRVTFQRLIEQYCNKGDISGATKILEHMSEKELPVNEVIFNSLIKGHSEAGDISNAVKVLDLMKQAGIEPSSRSYTAVLCAHGKQGDIEAIRAVLNECTEKDIQFSDKEILDVIYTLALNGHAELIDEMMTLLVKGSMYNKEAIVYILKLIEKNHEEVAYKLLKSLVKSPNRFKSGREDAIENDGNFFLRKLVSNDTNVETIINYCKRMKEEKLNNVPFEIATYAAFTNGMHHMALPLLKAWKESGGEIREHYFYPIFISFSKTNNLQGVLNTMRTMIFDYDIQPTIHTVKEYILPCMVEDAVSNLETLINNNLSFAIAANAVLWHLLNNNRTKQAAKLISYTRMPFRSKLLLRPLVGALDRTKDLNSIIELLHHQCIYLISDATKNENENPEERMTAKEFISAFVVRAVNEIPKYNTDLITECLHQLLVKGMSIDEEAAQKVRGRLGQNINPTIEDLLSNLVSQEFAPESLSSYEGEQKRIFMNKKLLDLEKTSEMSPEFKIIVIQQQCKMRNKEVIEKLLQEVLDEKIPFTVGFCATLFDYYAKIENLEEAEKWFKKTYEIDPDCKINKSKILNYATVLIKNNRETEALQVLQKPMLDADADRNILCEKILYAISNHCPDRTEEFFILMEQNKYFQKITASLVASLVREPLDAGDLNKAVEKFKWTCENYKVTPLKNILMMKLIDAEDAKSLQIITDLTTQVYGQMNALYDLATSFFDCNRTRQARKILETPGLRLRKDRIEFTANKYFEQGQTERLEKFIPLITDLYMDMDPLYVLLLKAYDKEGDWQKGLALWTQMQEDNIQPSTAFMHLLEQILRRYNQDIPFGRSTDIDNFDKVARNFHNAMVAGNLKEAEKLLNKMPEEMRDVYTAQLIDAEMAEGNVKNVINKVENLLQKDVQMVLSSNVQNVISKLIKKLAEIDDFDSIVKLISTWVQTIKNQKSPRNYTFNYDLNLGYIESGRYLDFITHLEDVLDNPANDKSIVSMLFHTTVAVKALHEVPELEEKFRKFANKAYENKIAGPINALWISEMLKDSPEAEKIFEEYLKNTSKIHTLSALYACKERQAWDKLLVIAEKLQSAAAVHLEDKRRTFAAMLKILLDSNEPNKYELAFECLREACKVIPIHRLNHKILKTIEENLTNGQTIESLKEEIERRQNTATG